MLFGQEWIHGVGTIPSTVHQKLFFWNEEGSFVVVNGDRMSYDSYYISIIEKHE